jgi:hypothetical protein
MKAKGKSKKAKRGIRLAARSDEYSQRACRSFLLLPFTFLLSSAIALSGAVMQRRNLWEYAFYRS